MDGWLVLRYLHLLALAFFVGGEAAHVEKAQPVLAAMGTDLLRAVQGVDGTGVLVGTMSDSYDCMGGAAGDAHASAERLHLRDDVVVAAVGVALFGAFWSWVQAIPRGRSRWSSRTPGHR